MDKLAEMSKIFNVSVDELINDSETVSTNNTVIDDQPIKDKVVEKKTNMEFDIFIKGNELYLRFHSGDMFEPENLKNGALDKDAIR